MSENLLHPRHQNWNIPNPDELEMGEPHQHDAGVIDQIFPIRSYSSLGGGDATMRNSNSAAPRVRSRLFTISTRSVMASHSQLNVSYTTSTTSVDADAIANGFVPLPQASSSAHSQLDYEKVDNFRPLEDVKPINSDERLSISPVDAQPSTSESDDDVKGKECRANITKSRCFHTSLEDIRSKPKESAAERRHPKPKETDKNRRNSAPISNVRGQMIEAANELLVDENKYLHATINNIRRRLLLTKSALGFVMQGVHRRGKVIKGLEVVNLERKQQCAARLILHSMLLNSWRNIKRELNMRIDDNAELRKSVENFSLQVQVLRHIQTSERQKSQEKSAIIENMNDEFGIMKEENLIMRKEMDKMESKLNSLQASAQTFSEKNQILTKEIKEINDNRDKLVQSLDRERVRSEQFRMDNETMKETLHHLESQLSEATEQRSHWQERARCSESEAWELKLHLETSDCNIKDLNKECHALREDRIHIIEEKSSLKTDLDRTTSALQTLGEKTDELLASYEEIKAEKDSKARIIEELEKALEMTKQESRELDKELMSYKLHNVRRRREWGNALYFIASPMDAVRRKWS